MPSLSTKYQVQPKEMGSWADCCQPGTCVWIATPGDAGAVCLPLLQKYYRSDFEGLVHATGNAIGYVHTSGHRHARFFTINLRIDTQFTESVENVL